MYSKLAYEARKSRVIALRRLKLTERLKALSTHRRLMMELNEAGKKIRENRRDGHVPMRKLDQ